jgi:hypothetical protein
MALGREYAAQFHISFVFDKYQNLSFAPSIFHEETGLIYHIVKETEGNSIAYNKDD